MKRIARMMAAGSLASLLAIPLAGCNDTYTVGICNGAVAIRAAHGLVTTVGNARCDGDVTYFRLNLKLFANGELVTETFSETIPDGSGYSLRLHVVCVAHTRYVARVRATVGGPNGVHHYSNASSSLRIKRQGECA